MICYNNNVGDDMLSGLYQVKIKYFSLKIQYLKNYGFFQSVCNGKIVFYNKGIKMEYLKAKYMS